MDDETHKALLAAMSDRTLTEAEIVERVGAYVGNVTDRQRQELSRIAAQSYPDSPVRSAIRSLHGNSD
jgi:hypothetical protein